MLYLCTVFEKILFRIHDGNLNELKLKLPNIYTNEKILIVYKVVIRAK